jgi:protein gp37
MDLAWVRELRAKATATGTAFFFKQSTAPRTEMGIHLDGEVVREYPTPRVLSPYPTA